MNRKSIALAALGFLAAVSLALANEVGTLEGARLGKVGLDRISERASGEEATLTIPWYINYQGYLTDNAGNPISDTLSLAVRIFDSEVGGTQLWSVLWSQYVVENGLFNLVLDRYYPIPPQIFETGARRWLELQVEGQVLTPRTEITSAGYAYRAVNTDKVDGFHVSEAPDSAELFPAWVGDARYLNEGQADGVTGDMVLDGTLARPDVAPSFKAPFADTADYALAAGSGSVDSARVSGNSWRLESHTLFDLDSLWVAEGQADAITSGMIVDGTIARADVQGSFKAPYSDTADYAFNAVTDSDWVKVGTVLFPSGRYGLASSSSSYLTGESTYTHINLGIACTTGTVAADYRYCTVGGGWRNSSKGVAAVVAGGYMNVASGHRGTVGGGELNAASEWYATVAGGERNSATNRHCTVGGGYLNLSSGYRSTVGGGYGDTASADYAVIAGGQQNRVSGAYAVVGGGYLGLAQGANATVGGGYADTATASYSAVGGGIHNKASAPAAAVSGGSTNLAAGDASTVSGGYQNSAMNPYSTVAGGWNNAVTADHGTVSGGNNNRCQGQYSSVGGGFGNTAGGARSSIAGGSSNSAAAAYSSVAGGSENYAGGLASAVGGGYRDSVGGDYSYVTGYGVKADTLADYTFAFGRAYTTSTPNAVIFHNSVNPIRVGIGNAAPTHLLDVGGSGAYCDGGVWVDGSSREYKENIVPLSSEDAESALAGLVPVRYNYKSDPREQCVGFVAEDVPDLVATKDRKGLSPMDIVAVLTEVVKNQQREIELLRQEIEALKKK